MTALHTTSRPQPVLTRAGIVTGLSTLAALLVHFNAGPAAQWIGVNQDAIAGLILAAGPTVSGFLASKHVTPLSDPQTADGVRLVPVGTVSTVGPLLVDEAVPLPVAEPPAA